MNFIYKNKKISGILSVIPKNEVTFDDELMNYNFDKKKSLKLKKIMGYDKHRIVEESTCISDLCIFGLRHLINEDIINKDDIDALILITQTPDYLIPPSSYIIQGKLGFKEDMLCMDINQGCAGYLIGLIQAFTLLENKTINKVVLLNADILSKKVSKGDRNSYPLIGDGAAVTIIERDIEECEIYANLKIDGTRRKALMIPAGGLRIPSTTETSKLEMDVDGNYRSKDNLVMDGKAVFNFVQADVPHMIDSLLEFSGITTESIDYFMFHQPNKFMLKKLADKINVSYDKMPNNIVENFGNSSGVTIPINITFNLGEKLKNNMYTICLAGFGVGLTWSSMLINIGLLDFCEIIEY